jgi:hypothetical protein
MVYFLSEKYGRVRNTSNRQGYFHPTPTILIHQAAGQI